MKKRRILSVFAALTLTVGLWAAPAAYPIDFWSPPAEWAREQMEDLADAGILDGGFYDPTVTMTRGNFCYFMVNVVQRTGRRELLNEVEPMPVGYFSDVTSSDGFGGWYNVYTAAAYGLTEGAWVEGQRLAQTEGRLTREQGAKMMCSLMDALGRFTGLEVTGGASADFVDADTISPWAKESVDRASALGILKGDEAGRFNPQGVLTFQEACVMLDRAFRQAEEAAVKWDADHGITSLATQLEGGTVWGLENSTMQMHWLEKGRGESVLWLRRDDEGNSVIQVEDYDDRGNSAGVKEIPVELEYCAAFYEGEEAYYLAFGQNNMEEDDGKEVYRIVKYDRDWKRLGAASVTAGESYTTQPYRSTTHTAMAEHDGTLVLHTARLRYQSSDGLRHQSNITIKVRTADMSVLSVSPRSPGNHVSHSFAQYVVFDGDEPVYADHGDAYPRGFTLNLDTATGYGKEMNFFPFSGAIGDNTTNAYPGGFGIGADHYLFAGSSSPQDGNDKRTYCNVFLAVVPKKGFPNGKAEVQWLTRYPRTGEEYVSSVRLVQMNNNTFVVLWQSSRTSAQTAVGDTGAFCYAVFDGAGNQVGKTRTVENFLMPLGDPTVVGDRIVWVRPESGSYNVFINSRSRYLKRYELEIEMNDEAEETPAGPTDFTLSRTDFTFSQRGEVYDLTPRFTPRDAVAEVTWRSTDPSVATVSWNGTVTAVGEGTTTVIVTVEGLGSKSCTVRCNFKDPTATPDPTESPRPTEPSDPTGTTRPAEDGPATTVLPADGITDRYCLNWGKGKWMEIEVVDGDTIRLSGCMPELPDYYNYVVLQAYREQAEVPLVPGEEFSMEVTIDVEGFLKAYEESSSKIFYVTAMVCQNHEPGEANLAGISFGNSICLVPNGSGGCTFRVIER